MKYCYKILKIYYDSMSKLFLDIRIRIPGNYTTLKMEKKEKKKQCSKSISRRKVRKPIYNNRKEHATYEPSVIRMHTFKIVTISLLWIRNFGCRFLSLVKSNRGVPHRNISPRSISWFTRFAPWEQFYFEPVISFINCAIDEQSREWLSLVKNL